MKGRLRAPGLAAAAVVLTMGGLTACSGEDTPAICSDMDALKASVNKVTDVKLEQGALPTLRSALTAVKSDFTQVKKDAESQYASEVDAVDQAAASLSTKLQAADAAPSAETVAAVGTAVRGLGTSLTALKDAVASTC